MKSDEVAAIGDLVLHLLDHKELGRARSLLEGLFAAGHAPEPMLVAYAVVLSELGAAERAAEVGQLIRASNLALSPEIIAYLPGGKDSASSRRALQSDAERFFPRGPRS